MAINTNGWDTIYALSFADMNKAIAKNLTATTAVNVVVDNDGNVPAQQNNAPTRTITGQLVSPQLTPGGSGSDVYLAVTMQKGGTFKYDPAPPGKRPASITLQEVNIVVKVNLEWVSTGKPFVKNLKTGAASPMEVMNIVYNDDSLAANQKLDMSERNAYFQPAVEYFFEKNPGFFQTVFASAMINDAVDQGASFAWAKPTLVSYAVADTSTYDLNTSVFGILCMTGNRPAPHVDQVPGECIPVNADAKTPAETVNSGFIISAERVMEDLFLPLVPVLFQDADVSNFQIDGNSISNIKSLTLHQMELDNGNKVNPTVDLGGFSLSIKDTALEMVLQMDYEHQPGYTVTMSNTSNLAIFLGVQDGKQVLQSKYLYGTNHVEVTVAGWVEGLAIAADIGGALLAGLIAAAAEGGLSCWCKGKAVDTSTQVGGLIEMNTIASNAGGAVEEVSGEVAEFARHNGWTEYQDFDEGRVLKYFKFDPYTNITEERTPQDMAAAFATATNRMGVIETRTQGDGVEALVAAVKGICRPVGQFFSNNRGKFVALLTLALESGISIIPIVTIENAIKSDNIPTLDNLTQEVVNQVVWPNLSPKGYTLLTAQVNGGLQFGIRADFA